MTVQPLSQKDRKALHTLSIDTDVVIAAGSMDYIGPGIGYIGLFSMLPGVSSRAKIEQVVSSHHIQIDNIVRNHFIDAVQHHTDLELVRGHESKADAHLQLTVLTYGFRVPQSYSAEVAPVLMVEAKLIRQGVVVWQNHYRTSVLFGRYPTYRPVDLITHPELIALSWERVAKFVANYLVYDFNEENIPSSTRWVIPPTQHR